MLDQLNDAAASIGGTWVRLRSTDDPPVEGEVIDFEVRPKTFEGAPVLSRKTGQQRSEWVFTLRVPGQEEAVKLSLNEAGQRAVAKALKDANAKAKAGDTLKIRVKENAPDSTSQATYQARWTVGAASLDVPVPAAGDDDSDPF